MRKSIYQHEMKYILSKINSNVQLSSFSIDKNILNNKYCTFNCEVIVK